MPELIPRARWTDDCQGKQNYDGRLLSISTRYWPGPEGGGGMTYDTETKVIGTLPYGKQPSAVAAIHLEHGVDDFIVLREASFTASTEAEVKAAVEQWVREQVNEFARLVRFYL